MARKKWTPAAKRKAQLSWLKRHRNTVEDPPGSNSDHRRYGIRHAQQQLGSWLVGLALCGTWVAAALRAGHVNLGERPWELAGVANIEDRARRGERPFKCWVSPADALA